jgi:hypothetical protein
VGDDSSRDVICLKRDGKFRKKPRMNREIAKTPEKRRENAGHGGEEPGNKAACVGDDSSRDVICLKRDGKFRKKRMNREIAKTPEKRRENAGHGGEEPGNKAACVGDDSSRDVICRENVRKRKEKKTDEYGMVTGRNL